MKKLLLCALPALALAACNQQPYAQPYPQQVVQPQTVIVHDHSGVAAGFVGGMIVHHMISGGYHPYGGYYGSHTVVHHYGSYGGYGSRTVHVYHH